LKKRSLAAYTMRGVFFSQPFLDKRQLRAGHIGTTSTSAAMPCAMTICNGCERPFAAADQGGTGRVDQRRDGDNSSPPKDAEPDSAEVRAEEA